MIHVIVKTGSIIDEVTYPSVEDFIEDWLTWEILEDGLNTYYDPVDLPYIGKVEMGKLIMHYAKDIGMLDEIRDDFVMYYTEQIEDDLQVDGRCDFNGMIITDDEFIE